MTLPIILALDTKEIDQAQSWIKAASGQIDHFKIGLEFFLRHGITGIEKLRQSNDFKLFLDLKLYDIPNTIKGAVESVANLNPKFLTVHAAGGAKMISVAARALPTGSITAVTVLTSFSEIEFQEMGQRQSIEDTTKNWAKIALSAGATSLVCSPIEVSALRQLSDSAILITPGVRLEGDDPGDQARVMTPKQALSAGADFVVIGRSITKEWDGKATQMQKKIDLIATTLV